MHAVVSKLSSSWENSQPRNSVSDGLKIPGFTFSPPPSPENQSKTDTPEVLENKDNKYDKCIQNLGMQCVTHRLVVFNQDLVFLGFGSQR